MWNAEMHLGRAFYVRRGVFDNASFRGFVRAINWEHGAVTRMWSAAGLLSMWALLVVPRKCWRDASQAFSVTGARVQPDEVLEHFPLNKELRQVREILAEPLGNIEVVQLVLNRYRLHVFQTPPNLCNHTCSRLSPQMWPECISTVVDEHSIEAFLHSHQYLKDSPHFEGYKQLYDVLLQHSGRPDDSTVTVGSRSGRGDSDGEGGDVAKGGGVLLISCGNQET